MSEDGQAVAALLERLRASVIERRASGQYPPGLEADLDAHFQRIVASRRQAPALAALRRQIEAARRASHFSPDRIPTSTRLPGGSALHKGLSRLFLRQAYGILLQVQEFADRTLEALDAVAVVAERPDNHEHVQLIEQIDAHSEALAALARESRTAGRPADSADVLDDIARRLARLEQVEAARQWRPWFGRERFESVFDQGRRHALAQRTAAALGHRAPVLEVSVDGDEHPLAALAAATDASMGAIVAIGADEVLTAQQIVDLVAMAYERLAPDGRLLVSCGAPPEDGARPQNGPRPRFDPTRGPPLPAGYVAFACREAGFAAVVVEEWSDEGYLVAATR